MEALNCLSQVAEFHQTFGHPILPSPLIPSKERTDLRVSLLTEELKELQQGIDNSDIVEIADALCDIQYVLAGAILEFGLGDRFKELFDEVQRSNMSKACEDEEEASETVVKYESDGIECYYKQIGDKFVVYRKSDNKVMKNIYYSSAKLSSIITNL